MHFKSLLAAMMLALCMGLTLSPARGAGMTNAETAQYKWRFATMAPKSVGWSVHVEELLFPAIMEECGGKLFVKVYWGGVLGDDEQVAAKIREGQLDGGGFGGQGATLLCPDFAVLELPFLFRNYQEVDYVKEKMSGVMDSYFEKNGMKLILWNDQDFDQIYSLERPVASLEDFRRTRFIVWYGPIEKALLERLGAQAVEARVPEAAGFLRQGKAEAGIAPAIWMAGSQLYSVLRYVNPMKIRYAPALIASSSQAWRALPEEDRTRLESRKKELEEAFCKGVRKDNDACYRGMVEYGVQEAVSTPEELEQIRQRAVLVWEDLAGKLYARELLDEVLGRLKEFREKTP